MSGILLREERDGIVTLTMNDPRTLNALSDAMLAALAKAFDGIAESGARVVVLRGEGRAFCAGHHLREMQAMRAHEDGGRAAFADLFDRCAAVMARIRTLPQPVIARVHGLATAAGCQLVATCDLAVAAEEAEFGVNGVDIGLFCSTPMVALTRNVGRKRAFEIEGAARGKPHQEERNGDDDADRRDGTHQPPQHEGNHVLLLKGTTRGRTVRRSILIDPDYSATLRKRLRCWLAALSYQPWTRSETSHRSAWVRKGAIG